MSDGAYLLLASVVALAFVLIVLGTNPPEGRNPHVDARRQRRWWTRDHD